MLTGDDRLIQQSESVLGDISYAALKRSTAFFSGEHLPLGDCRELLRTTARRAVEGATKLVAVKCELPVTIEVDLSADPGRDPALAAREDDNFTCDDYPSA